MTSEVKHIMVDWNEPEDNYSEFMLNQLKKMMWFEDEFAPSNDKEKWEQLNTTEQDTYLKVLAGLTGLDFFQGGNHGIDNWMRHIHSPQKLTVFKFIEMEEVVIHAKSYSRIFSALATSMQIKKLKKWVEEHPTQQYKMNRIMKYYKGVTDNLTLYLALAASCILEGKLFYTGFFFPLYLSGKGYMMASGEIIKKIMLDENIHGIYTGLVAQEIYSSLSEEERSFADEEFKSLVYDLYENELRYIQELYADLGLTHKVKNFLRYNTNKVCMNLGKEPIFEHVDIDPIVLNALSTEAENHDFFSMKGSSYVKATIERMKKEDWKFEGIEG